jgi:hypothetical protein
MWAERYILVTEGNTGADAGRDAETDVAIEDDGMEDGGMEDNGGAGDRDSRSGGSYGDRSTDVGCSAGRGPDFDLRHASHHADAYNANDNDNANDNKQDWTLGSSDLCQPLRVLWWPELHGL